MACSIFSTVTFMYRVLPSFTEFFLGGISHLVRTLLKGRSSFVSSLGRSELAAIMAIMMMTLKTRCNRCRSLLSLSLFLSFSLSYSLSFLFSLSLSFWCVYLSPDSFCFRFFSSLEIFSSFFFFFAFLFPPRGWE